MMQMIVTQIQKQLEEYGIDGWLLYDFHGSNKLARELLKIPSETMLTRRFFYWIPRKGNPEKIVHRIESDSLDQLPGGKHLYLSWTELEQVLGKVLKKHKTVAMEYSPHCGNPYVSVVDAGTIEILRDMGIEVVSSADLLQHFTSVLDEKQIESHMQAADVLKKTAESVWDLIADQLRLGKKITEYDVQQFMLSEFLAHDCIAEEGPICAANGHSALPHYVAQRDSSLAINRGDFVLIDLWCKKNFPGSIYADITRVAIAAPEATPKQQEVFKVIKGAIDKGIELITARMKAGLVLKGSEVDDICREYITEKGYGPYFLHRTGHNIGTSVHGAGAHLDNLETSDNRHILPGTCFSIEPGIYLEHEFGIRVEYDIVITHDREVKVTGGRQESIICLPL